MSQWPFLIAGIVIGLMALWWEMKSPCKCGRSAPPYFFKDHPTMPPWYFWAFFATVTAALMLFTMSSAGDAILVFFMSLLSAYYWLRIIKHESGKIKKAARALGRVVVKDNGRLGIEHG